MILMVQRKRSSLSDMKERLYRMRMEIQELEDTLEECDNNTYTYDDKYDGYEDRGYHSYQGRERGYRGRY